MHVTVEDKEELSLHLRNQVGDSGDNGDNLTPHEPTVRLPRHHCLSNLQLVRNQGPRTVSKGQKWPSILDLPVLVGAMTHNS